jgi:hypothetical protein
MRRIFGLQGKEVKEALQGKAHCLDWQSNITMGRACSTHGRENKFILDSERL